MNVAGVTGPIETPVQDIKVDDFDYVIIANERGTFLPIKHVVPTMIAQKAGKIVNISGTSGLRGYPMRTAYSASKWAVRGITRTVALELGKYNVNVNAVCPGIVPTPMWAQIDQDRARLFGAKEGEAMAAFIQQVPLKRAATPEDLAGVVAFLCSADADYVTGQAINVDGGYEMN